MPRRAAQGSGTIRKNIVTRNGKTYTYWEARYTVGTDPGTGKQVQKSISGATQAEVRKRLIAATSAIDTGTYQEPSKMTVKQWSEVWLNEYASKSVKPNTLVSYKVQFESHINPNIGAVTLQSLKTHQIQQMYNRLIKVKGDESALSPKSVHNCHCVLHKCLEQAVKIGYMRFNPASSCELPRTDKKKIKPLDEANIGDFIKELDDEQYKNLFITALFTGMRESELLGLQWNCIDLKNKQITVDKQLVKLKGKDEPYILASTKSGKERTITVASYVTEALKAEKVKQTENQLKSYGLFNNLDGLVFTDEMGKHLVQRTVVKHFKNIANKIGIPDARFHDLRHTFATMSLHNGDSIKDVQSNLGHSSATITLDLYAHVTKEMKQISADRMDAFINEVCNEK